MLWSVCFQKSYQLDRSWLADELGRQLHLQVCSYFGSVVRDPVDGLPGARYPCECFGLVLFWDGDISSLFIYYFKLPFSWAEFFLLARVLELDCAPSRSFSPGPRRAEFPLSQRLIPLLSHSVSLEALMTLRDEINVTCVEVLSETYGLYEHILCSPDGDVPQVTRVPAHRDQPMPRNSCWPEELPVGLFIHSPFDYFSGFVWDKLH